MASIQTQYGFGYNASNIECDDGDVFISVCGNSLRFHGVEHHGERFLFGAGRGIGGFCCSRKQHLVAYFDKGVDPKIYVHDTRSFELLVTLDDGAKLEFGAMAFSRDGKWLCTASREPDRKIIVWDWKKSSRVVENTVELDITQLSFNPFDRTMICTTGPGEVLFWQVEESFKKMYFEPKSVEVAELGEFEALCHEWNPKGGVYVGLTSGELLLLDAYHARPMEAVFDPDQPPSVVWADTSGAITSIAVSKDHVCLGDENGVLRWYNHAEEGKEPHDPDHEIELGKWPVCSMSFGASFGFMIVGTAESVIHEIRVNVDGEGDFAESMVVGDYHLGRVTGVGVLPGGDHVVSCGEDGTLRCWNPTIGDLSCKLFFSSEQTCLTVSDANGLIAVGAQTGVIRLVSAAKPTELLVMWRSKLYAGVVKAIAFSPNGEMVVVAFEDGKLFFVAVTPASASATVVGHTWTPEKVPCDSVAWQGDMAVLLSLANGEVARMEAPSGTASTGPDLELAAREVPCRRLKMDVPLTAIQATGADGLVGLGVDKSIRAYSLPGDQAGWTGPKGREKKPEGSVEAHGKAGTALSVSGCGRAAVSGSLDGGVRVRSVQRPENLYSTADSADHILHDMKLGGVTAVGLGAGNLVCTAGADGAVFIGMVNDLEFSAPGSAKSLVPSTAQDEDMDLDSQDEPTVVEVARQRAVQREADKYQAHQAKMREKILALKAKFDECLRRNEAAPKLEQMSRAEFIIDQELCDKLKADGDTKAAAVKASIQEDNLRAALIAQRVKETCWDPMVVHGVQIKALKTDTVVRNYPLAAQDEAEKPMNKVILLRTVELAEAEYEASVGHVGFELNAKVEGEEGEEGEGGGEGGGGDKDKDKAAGAADPPADEAAEDGGDEKDDEGGSKKSTTDTERLLYSPFELACPRRRVTQMWILRKLVRETQEEFNRKWEAMTRVKHTAMDKVGEINLRIKECAEELGHAEAVFVPVLSEEEIAESVLKVTDADIHAEKWVPPAERARLAEEARIEDERNRLRSKDSPEERALKQMMNGTLEVPKEKTGMDAPIRPEWMSTIERSAMTKEQIKELTEFDAMEKAWMEEREKYLKGFETELRKLKSDVDEVCAKFDGELAGLLSARIGTDRRVYELQLGIIGLARALEQREESEERHEADLAAEMAALGTKRGETSAQLTEFKAVADEFRDVHDAMHAEDRALDKAFRKDFAECEVNVDSLYKLYRRRHKVARALPAEVPIDPATGAPVPPAAGQPKRGPSFASKSIARRTSISGGKGDAMVTPRSDHQSAQSDRPLDNTTPREPEGPDPFKMADVSKERREEPVEPLDPYYDRPEGLETIWWDKLVEARQRKIQSEADLKKQGHVMSEVTKHLNRLTKMDAQVRVQAESVYRELEKFRDHRGRELYNLEVPLHLKQGQMEAVAPEASADLGDAVLCHRSVVEDVNGVIVKHGDQKVEILTAIKDFKKGIYELEWLNQKLDMDAEDLVERTREFQLLRVTKQLQAFLKTGDEGGGGSIEAGALESRIEHNRKLHQKLVEEKRARLRTLNRNIADKRGQNSEMRAQVGDLDRAVDEQARIREGQAGAESAADQQARRMRRLVTSRKLKDIARAQGEELMMLREELERLRLRTFPSFVDRDQSRIALSPDERITLST